MGVDYYDLITDNARVGIAIAKRSWRTDITSCVTGRLPVPIVLLLLDHLKPVVRKRGYLRFVIQSLEVDEVAPRDAIVVRDRSRQPSSM